MATRRDLFALGGAALLAGGGTGALGAEVVPGHSGITIKIVHHYDGWKVCVPDWDMVSKGQAVQGFLVAMKWMPLADFLKEMEELMA